MQTAYLIAEIIMIPLSGWLTLAYREASTLAFADAFRVIVLAFVIAILLVPLMRKVAAPKAPIADAH